MNNFLHIPEITEENIQKFHRLVQVGSYPNKRNPEWDFVLGVTDEYCPVDDAWYPSGENPCMTFSIIYPCMLKLLQAFNCNKNIYIHCTAGINRSVTIRDAFYYMLFDTNYPGSKSPEGSGRPDNGMRSGLMRNIQNSKLPQYTLEYLQSLKKIFARCLDGHDLLFLIDGLHLEFEQNITGVVTEPEQKIIIVPEK